MMHNQCAGQSSTSGVAGATLQGDDRGLSGGSSSSSSKMGKSSDGTGVHAAEPVQVECSNRAGESRRATREPGGARVPAGGQARSEAGPGQGGERGSCTYAYYVVTSDGDDYMAPNAFKIPKCSTCVTLRDVKDYFPLPGTYHFRFKVRVKEAPWGTSTEHASNRHRLHQQPFVWLDVLEDCHCVPLYEHRIHIKATRLSWQQEPRTAEVGGIAEAYSVIQGDRQSSHGIGKDSSSRMVAPSRQQHHVAAAQQTQEPSGAGTPPNAAPEQLLMGDVRGHGKGFSAAAPPPATASIQQQQTQQNLTWVLEGKKKPESAAAAASMLLFDDDLPPTRDVREPASSTAKGRKENNQLPLAFVST